MDSLDVVLCGFFILIAFLFCQAVLINTDIYSYYLVLDDLLGYPYTKPYGEELALNENIIVTHNSTFTGNRIEIK